MLVYILTCVVTCLWQVFNEVVGACPAPVVWPEMYIAIAYVPVLAYLLIESIITLASPCAFTANAYKVVLVDSPNEC